MKHLAAILLLLIGSQAFGSSCYSGSYSTYSTYPTASYSVSKSYNNDVFAFPVAAFLGIPVGFYGSADYGPSSVAGVAAAGGYVAPGGVANVGVGGAAATAPLVSTPPPSASAPAAGGPDMTPLLKAFEALGNKIDKVGEKVDGFANEIANIKRRLAALEGRVPAPGPALPAPKAAPPPPPPPMERAKEEVSASLAVARRACASCHTAGKLNAETTFELLVGDQFKKLSDTEVASLHRYIGKGKCPPKDSGIKFSAEDAVALLSGFPKRS